MPSFLPHLVFGLLFSLKILPVVWFAPPFSTFPIPLYVKFLIATQLGFMLSFAMPAASQAFMPMEAFHLVFLGGTEFLTGLFIAGNLALFFSIFQISGQILDSMVGFNVSALIDYSSKRRMPIFGFILNLAAIILFIHLNGLGYLLEFLVTFSKDYPNEVLFNAENIVKLLAFSNSIFYFGLVAIFPVFISVFLVDILLLTMAKTMPQINIFFLSIAIKPLIGMVAFVFALTYIFSSFQEIFIQLNHFWLSLLT